TMPDSVTSIGARAFNRCFGLSVADISPKVTSIGSGAFFQCLILVSVRIPEGVRHIENRTFSGCRDLIDVSISNGVLSIGFEAFSECGWKAGLKTIDIPGSVTSIGASAFFGCSTFTSMSIPGGVKSIEDGVFEQCSRLKSITIPSGVTSIEEKAFLECIRLTSVTIPDSVTSIGKAAFSGCVTLPNVTIPVGVTSIGSSAFSECRSLTYAYFLGLPPDLHSNVFADVDPMFTVIYVNGTQGFMSPLWNGYPSRNLLAYALNLDPDNSISIQIPTIEFRDGVISMRFYGAADGIIYAIEVSEDLITWMRRDDLLIEPDDGGFRKVVLSLTEDTQFVRLSVSIK
ncbi:MAG: hypothetical protein ACI9R3_004415, partial [Verrucomicrobiales bacterium]